MQKRNQHKKGGLSDQVLKARAGIIFACDAIEEEKRVRTNHTTRIIRIVKAYSRSVARVTDDHAITSLLADLRHYCDCKGLAFEELDAAAHVMYFEEKADEAA